MTIKSITNLFEDHTTLWSVLFSSFDYGHEDYYSQNQNIVYRQVYSVTPEYSEQQDQYMIYKWVLIFSDKSYEGLQNQLEIKSNLNTAVLIYMNDFKRFIDDENIQIDITNPTYLHYQQAGLDQVYNIRAEFNIIVPLALCASISNYDPICNNTPPPVCDFEIANVQAFVNRGLLTIQTEFSSIIGADFFEVYLRNSISSYSMIYIDNTPQLINVFGQSFPGAETYFVRIDWYDNCGNIRSQEFGPFVLP